MDELDIFWNLHFGVEASRFERRLLSQIMLSIAPGDPLFVIAAMLARQTYTALGENEKAVLMYGPVISSRLKSVETMVSNVSSDLAAILNQVRQLEQRVAMLNARLIDTKRSMTQRLMQRAIDCVDADYRTTLPWVVALCLSFICGVAAVSFFAG